MHQAGFSSYTTFTLFLLLSAAGFAKLLIRLEKESRAAAAGRTAEAVRGPEPGNQPTGKQANRGSQSILNGCCTIAANLV
jgi:hypothetical protein